MKFTSHEFCRAVTSIAPVSSNSATLAGTAVDCKGFDECLVVLNEGIATGGTSTTKVQESSDDAVADPYADVAGAAFAAVTTANDVTIYAGRLDLSARERYLRAYCVGDGANAHVISVVFILLRKKYPPATQVETLAFNIDSQGAL